MTILSNLSSRSKSFFATSIWNLLVSDTEKRRRIALFSAASILLEIETSSSRESRGTCPICFKYILTGSSSESDWRLLDCLSSFSSRLCLKLSISSSVSRISTFKDSKMLRTFSYSSGRLRISVRYLFISWFVRYPFSFERCSSWRIFSFSLCWCSDIWETFLAFFASADFSDGVAPVFITMACGDGFLSAFFTTVLTEVFLAAAFSAGFSAGFAADFTAVFTAAFAFAVFSDFVGVFDVLVAIVYRRNFLPFDFFYPRRRSR